MPMTPMQVSAAISDMQKRLAALEEHCGILRRVGPQRPQPEEPVVVEDGDTEQDGTEDSDAEDTTA